MTPDARGSREARRLRARADDLEWDARTLEKVGGRGAQSRSRDAEAAELRKEADRQEFRSSIDETSVRLTDRWRETKAGRKNYPQWVSTWDEGGRAVTRYIGSCSKMTEAEALEKARKMKAEALGGPTVSPTSSESGTSQDTPTITSAPEVPSSRNQETPVHSPKERS